MSDYLHRLQIPPGKARYTLREAVTATSQAMHPSPSGHEEVVITAIDKTLIRDGDLLQRSRPVELEGDDWQLLRVIWSRLEHPVFPMPASQWKDYQDAFDASRNRPLNWSLCVTQRDPDRQAALRRAATMEDHEGELKDAILQGQLMPRNAMTGARHRGDIVTIGDGWILPLSQFKSFCGSLLIEAIESQAPSAFVTATGHANTQPAPAVVPADPQPLPTATAPLQPVVDAGAVQGDTQRASETPTERDDRRYREFKAAGGDYINNGVRWKAIGNRGLVAAMAVREKKAGAPMHNEKDVREGLKKASARAESRRVAGHKGNSAFNL